jgi:carbonic anhydrase
MPRQGFDFLPLHSEAALMRLVHLQNHPSVAGAMARGELTMSGCVFAIGSGVVRTAEEERENLYR